MLSEKTISINLSRIMSEQNLNAHRLAIAAGISYSRVADIMNGRTKYPRIDTLAQISQKLGVTVDEMITDPVDHPLS